LAHPVIITKTPLRISFFGGGSDLPEYFGRHSGAVLGTSIDKYVYLSVTRFPSQLFDYNIRVAYSKVECVGALDQIEHSPVREALRHCGIERDIEISVAADLPSFSGLGTSSSFTVGLLKALHAHLGRHVGAAELMGLAIHLERDILHEAVGYQDQAFAAYGGFNYIEFSGTHGIHVERVATSRERIDELNQSLMMFYTGVKRRAGNVEQEKIAKMASIEENLSRMRRMVDEGLAILTSNRPLTEFGELLNRTWQEKRSLCDGVSTPVIDSMYAVALENGALGGKLLGAGGGGFMLLYAPPEHRQRVRAALQGFHEVEFSINAPGSAVIHS
jgi:D-glycero-alpha-D-manno-heptose-7-phosphate kinase